MIRKQRLLVLLVPIVLGLASLAGPGGAQTAGNSRYAFADTTLLRDTLGLHFDRLFELADSLRITPDTLRALSIRYLYLPGRLVELADSMRVPVDSVGPVLDRERFNPLNATVEHEDQVNYTSGYTVLKNNAAWRNNGDFRIVRGALFLHNVTGVSITRIIDPRRTQVQRLTDADTELGFRVHPTTSIGGRAVVHGFTSDDVSTNTVSEQTGDYQLSVRTRHKPRETITTELNGFMGLRRQQNAATISKGLGGEVNGQLTYLAGTWMTNDFNAQVTGNNAKSELVRTHQHQNGGDLGQTYRGNVTLFPAGRANFSTDFSYRDYRNQEADTANVLQPVRTANADLNLAARGRIDNDRTLNLTQTFGWGNNASWQRSGQNTRFTSSSAAQARYRLIAASLEVNFRLDGSTTQYPTLAPTGGYREDTETRYLDATLSRQLTQRITGRATAKISLARFDYSVLGEYTGLPITRDQTQQGYRIEAAWSPSHDLNSTVALDVQRTELVNIPSAAVSANNLLRTYRAEWNWTYRLFSMLTATQRNSVTSSYTAYRFNQASDRLAFDYNTTTTLNAVLTPRLTVDLTHNGQQQPSGGWVYDPQQNESFFQPADENRNYSLAARVSYTPFSGITLMVQPSYGARNRFGNDANGNQAPQREDRNLIVTGTVNLNVTVGRRGRLSGVIGPMYEANGSTSFPNGVPTATPTSATQNWTGSLSFAWTL